MRPVTSSRSTCRPPSTARTCRTRPREGLSHEVGSGRLIAGLDDALVGLSVDESKEFTAQLATGEHAGQGRAGHRHRQVDQGTRAARARRRVRATGQRVRHHRRAAGQPAAIRCGRTKRAQQAEQIRNAAIDALLEQVDVPLPEAIVQAQVDSAMHNALHGLDHDEAKLAEVLGAAGHVARGVRGRRAQRRRERTSRGSCCWTRWPTTWTSRSARTT